MTIAKSKTDPEGEGQTVGIPYGSHPVQALEAWLEWSNITYGNLFTAISRWGGEVSGKPICDQQLAKIIKRLAVLSSLATSVSEGGASERAILALTRQRSLEQVRRYIRRGRSLQRQCQPGAASDRPSARRIIISYF